MPARRQHRRGDRLTLKQRGAVRRTTTPWEPDLDEVWTEHQAYERVRRCQPLIEPPKPPPFDIRPVLAKVLADFARWRHEGDLRS